MDRNQKGFTLIEILVVVTIIGVLAGLVVVLIPKGQFEAISKQRGHHGIQDGADGLFLDFGYRVARCSWARCGFYRC